MPRTPRSRGLSASPSSKVARSRTRDTTALTPCRHGTATPHVPSRQRLSRDGLEGSRARTGDRVGRSRLLCVGIRLVGRLEHEWRATSCAVETKRFRVPYRPKTDRALPAADERQGRALPPNNGPRVGLRPRLPLLSTPSRRAATLARALQHAQAAQLDRRPAPDQPLSQRPWVGQLGAGGSPASHRTLRCRPQRISCVLERPKSLGRSAFRT